MGWVFIGCWPSSCPNSFTHPSSLVAAATELEWQQCHQSMCVDCNHGLLKISNMSFHHILQLSSINGEQQWTQHWSLGNATPGNDWWWEMGHKINSENSVYHFIVRSVKLIVFSSCSSRMEWSTVSNAADRPSRYSAITHPQLTAVAMSLNTLRSAVSVLWWWRYANCVLGLAADASRCATIRLCTFSMIFEQNDWSDTDLNFLKSRQFSPVFFSRGVMVVFLKASGKVPSGIDLLNSSIMNGASISICCLIIHHDIRSMLHVFLSDSHKSLTTSSFVTSAKHSSMMGEQGWLSRGAPLDVSSRMSNFLGDKMHKIIRCVISDDRCTGVSIPESGEILL